MRDLPSLSAMVEGPSGGGKSWLGSTTPPPRLIFDLEGRARYTPNGKGATLWDGQTDPMKLDKSKTRTYIVDCTRSLDPMAFAMQWIRADKHPFFSVTLDSLMEQQYQEREALTGGRSMKGWDDWGTLLRIMQAAVRDLTDLVKEDNRLTVALFIAGVIEKNGYQKPLMTGQITSQVPYWMDLVAYLEKILVESTNKTARRLWLDQRPENDLEVKDGTDAIISEFGPTIILGDRGQAPNFETMYDALVTAQKEE